LQCPYSFEVEIDELNYNYAFVRYFCSEEVKYRFNLDNINAKSFSVTATKSSIQIPDGKHVIPQGAVMNTYSHRLVIE